MFSCYDAQVSDDLLSRFISSESKWGWLKFLKLLSSGKYSKITFVTYNYDVWLERILKQLSLPYTVSGFEENASVEIEVIKPHGSISFVPRNDGCNAYSINYQLDFEGVPIDKLELKYSELDRYSRGALIPPAGDSMRLGTTAPWAQYLRTKAKEEALKVTAQDDVILCGISYWHVDRKEIDELLVSLNQDANFIFINPNPPRDLNAVLISIFKNYVHQSTSSEIGGILNG